VIILVHIICDTTEVSAGAQNKKGNNIPGRAT